MDRETWLAQVNRDAAELRSLLLRWHPASPKPEYEHGMNITAPQAEGASEMLRREIREARTTSQLPVEQFDQALAANDIRTIYNLLNEVWLGVPESTGCWGIEGFGEAVALLQDPPEN